MDEKLYLVKFDAMVYGEGELYVQAVTRNDARIQAIDFLNRVFKLGLAQWDKGEFDSWVRVSPSDEYFPCCIYKPEAV